MQPLQSKDIWLGLFLMLCGGWSYGQSQGFDSTSRAYPMLLSALIIILGLSFIIQAMKNKSKKQENIKEILVKIRGPFLIIGLMCIWVTFLSLNVGYLLSSLISVFLILIFISEKNKVNNIKITTLIVFSVFILFGVIFDVPLPLNTLTEHFLM
ncbi:hypothetical protein CSW98_07570 [Vibrio sp. HA2012]|uniref:tripartite tricarboxylate transporter TctB family protein n=1 Tax=Vibrio sp. HA2012 TaxID=1971595 RepID=UPI000C2BDBD9|nr:tripartite tricarboxylate transporter TctB family protein [Vibrio sp. HA2012]PJC86844.1 hypothetical protein CSW98_07570 [Vibrio sp. HA2012]